MNKCDICGKQLKSSQGLGGHKRFKHRVAGVAQGEGSSLVTEQSFPEILTKTLAKWSDHNSVLYDQLVAAMHESISGTVDKVNSMLADVDLMPRTLESELEITKLVSLRKSTEDVSNRLSVAEVIAGVEKNVAALVKYQIGIAERLSRLEKLNS